MGVGVPLGAPLKFDEVRQFLRTASLRRSPRALQAVAAGNLALAELRGSVLFLLVQGHGGEDVAVSILLFGLL